MTVGEICGLTKGKKPNSKAIKGLAGGKNTQDGKVNFSWGKRKSRFSLGLA